jgi:ABC-type uncharacterized transport system permease subunit
MFLTLILKKTTNVFRIVNSNFLLAVTLFPVFVLIYSKSSNKQEVIQYYSLIYLIFNITDFNSYDFQKKIKNNRIVKDILIPSYMNLYSILQYIYTNIPQSIFALTIIILTKNPIAYQLIQLKNYEYLYLISLLIIALFIAFYLNMINSFIYYWTENEEFSLLIKNQTIGFIAGMYFPIFLWPKSIYLVVFYSPFSFLYMHLINFFKNKEVNIYIIAIGLLWIAILYFVGNCVIKYGNLHYQNKKR